MATTHNLGTFLRKARTKAKVSQVEVARTLGYTSSQFVSNWERGLASPPPRVLWRLSKLYRVTGEELLVKIIEQTEENIRHEYKRGMRSN